MEDKIKLQYLLQEKGRIKRQIEEIEEPVRHELPDLKKKLEFVENWLKEFEKCPYCEGYGNRSVQYDQDDIRIETCRNCNGTGIRSEMK